MANSSKLAGGLVVPVSVQRRAGIKAGDRLAFQVSKKSITITVEEPPVYRPTAAEWAAIRKGEAELAKGESVDLSTILHDMDRSRRENRKKATRKVSR